jgi:hypothetical protein
MTNTAQHIYLTTQEGLAAQLRAFCKPEDLPNDSADELMLIANETQKNWLSGFSAQWDRLHNRKLIEEMDAILAKAEGGAA